eukprot:scaffold82699_cov35-Tisochrysis_lutea.AAC.4
MACSSCRLPTSPSHTAAGRCSVRSPRVAQRAQSVGSGRGGVRDRQAGRQAGRQVARCWVAGASWWRLIEVMHLSGRCTVCLLLGKREEPLWREDQPAAAVLAQVVGLLHHPALLADLALADWRAAAH